MSETTDFTAWKAVVEDSLRELFYEREVQALGFYEAPQLERITARVDALERDNLDLRGKLRAAVAGIRESHIPGQEAAREFEERVRDVGEEEIEGALEAWMAATSRQLADLQAVAGHRYAQEANMPFPGRGGVSRRWTI